MSKGLKTVCVFLLLTVAPLVSWYYLEAGLNYQIEIQDELEDFIKVPTEVLKYRSNLFDKNIVVFASINSEKTIGIFKKLHKQFDQRKDLKFHVMGDSDETKSLIAVDTQQISGSPLEPLMKVGFKKGFSNRLNSVVNQKLPIEMVQFDNNQVFMLADTSQQVRGYYDINNEEQVKRMVEHIAMLLPFKYEKRK